MTRKHSSPALHNAMWPGLVGKGPDSEPPIDLETMLNLTAAAEVDGVRFDGVDLFLSLPHTDIDSTDDDLARLAENISGKRSARGFAGCAGLARQPAAAPPWAIEDRTRPISDAGARRPAASAASCAISEFADYGVIRIDSAASPAEWAKDPAENTKRIAQTFREACTIAEDFGERLAAEGEICWGGMHSWSRNVELLEMVDRPKTLGLSGGHGAHHALHAWATTRRKIACCRQTSIGRSRRIGGSAIARWPALCGPGRSIFTWRRTMAPVSGSGSHDKTGRHCQPLDPNGKLDIVRDAGAWMRDDDGKPTRAVRAHLLGWLHVSRMQ